MSVTGQDGTARSDSGGNDDSCRLEAEAVTKAGDPRKAALFIIAAVAAISARPVARAESSKRLLACEFPFVSQASAATLSKHFGASNVTSAEIQVGEGDTEQGTVLFAESPEDRVEILWTEEAKQWRPRMVLLRGNTDVERPRSRWHTRMGLTLGIGLRTIERLNRRQFRLLGFSWDYEGTVMSWAGGALESEQSQSCHVRARLRPGARLNPGRTRWLAQVSGDREFSSGHPAMQALNPFIYEIWLEYRSGN